MRFIKKILLCILVFTISLFSFTGCGKILTVDNAEKQLTKVQEVIDKKFDYVELTRIHFDDESKQISEEVFLIHTADEKMYYALYNFVDEIENEGEGSEIVVSKKVLIQRFWEYKDGEAYKIVSEEIADSAIFAETTEDIKYDFSRIDVTIEEYQKDIETFHTEIYKNLLPESKQQLKADDLIKGNLSNTIVFECSEDIPEVQIVVNNATNKIHKATLYYSDGSHSEYAFNYPMIKGLVKKTEIPEIK